MTRSEHRIRYICLCSLLAGAAAGTGAVTKTWDAGAGTGSWSDDENWNPDGVPVPEDDVIINSDDDIIQDVQNFYTINSLKVYGTPGGSVTIVETYVFQINGDF